MGIFGGLKKAFKGYDFSERLQVAGALANGDYGAAAQIRAMGQKQRNEQQKAEQEAQAAAAAVQALVRQGIPEADAQVLVQSGAADTVLAGRYGQQNDSEFVRTLKMAGLDPAGPEAQRFARQRAETMATHPGQYIGTAETGYDYIRPPSAFDPPPQPPQTTQQEPIPFEGYVGATRSLGPQQAEGWLKRNNHVVAVSSPEQARQLPRGTRIRLPDGTEGVVP